MTAIASHPPLRLALTALWAVGTVLAVGAAVVISVGHDTGGAGEYAVTAAVLLALATATAHRSRTAIALGIVLCSLQPLAVVVTAWELTHRIPGAQATKIRALGIDPTVGVALSRTQSRPRRLGESAGRLGLPRRAARERQPVAPPRGLNKVNEGAPGSLVGTTHHAARDY